jgi:hypothetical protein
VNDNEAKAVRKLLVDALSGAHAHIEFDDVVKDFPRESRGAKPSGAPHSAWELVEHMRIALWDILEFSRDPNHKSPSWPKEYWPGNSQPPSPEAWDKSVDEFRKHLKEFDSLLGTQPDLLKPFEHGDGQTLFREALLLANHNSYHLGQLAYLKKQLSAM